MGHEVLFTASARRNLHVIPPRIVPAIIEFAFGALAREPHRVGKPLQRDLAGTYSARRGPYRLLYRIDDQAAIVYVLRVAYRADIYRPLGPDLL
jgi:mRNA interferase RelE/StbE